MPSSWKNCHGYGTLNKKSFSRSSRRRRTNEQSVSLGPGSSLLLSLTCSVQVKMIETATALDEKRVSKISELERLVKEQREALDKAHDRLEAAAAAPSLDSKIDGKGVKDLREEVYKLRKVVKERDEQGMSPV